MAFDPPLPNQGDPAPWGAALNAALGGLEGRVSNLEAIPPGSAQEVGVVQLDSFSGSTDDQKLTNALSYAASQSRIPWIRFPARQITLNQGGRVPFTGMKLCGPGPVDAAKNLEIGYPTAANINHRVVVGGSVGQGTSALFNGVPAGTIYAVNVSGLAFFNGNAAAQFWHGPYSNGANLYSCQFDSLTFGGFRHVFGNASSPVACTGVRFSGFWLCNMFNTANGSGVQFHLAGSDNELWTGSWLNIEGNTGNGTWTIDLNGMTKTTVGRIYSTNQQGWRGIRVRGNGGGLNFLGTTIEGRNAGSPGHGAMVSIEGGQVAMYGCWFGFGMSAPSTFGGGNNGIVQVSGGADVLIDRPYYARASGVAETVPFLYATGSGTRVTLRSAGRVGSWSGNPRYQAVNGATVTADSTFTAL